jgi:transcriptional regulator with XRE-family HTH domain
MTRPFSALMKFKPKYTNSDGFERCFRRSFSLSSGLLYSPGLRLMGGRPWTAEESRKLLELHQKGVSTSKITKELNTRSLLAVKSHIVFLRDPSPKRSSRKPWTAEEDAILAAKRQAGVTCKEIHIPGRSTSALYERWKYLRNSNKRLHGDARAARSNDGTFVKKYTVAEAERLFELRAKEHMSFQDIAKEMGLSKRVLSKLWFDRCKHLVPEHMLQELRPIHAWTVEDDNVLVTRYNKGEKMHALQACFPNRSRSGIKNRLYALQDKLVARQPKASPAQIESLKRELEPYVGATLEKADQLRIQGQFPFMSLAAIRATLHRMRKGKATSLRIPLDEMEAEGRIASRKR